MKKRVLWIFPKAEDSTSLWRGAGPMKVLAKQMPEIEFVELKEDVNWNILHGFDAVFLQRPSNHNHKAVVQLAKRMGIKIWLDYDDDLFNVPFSNPASLTYGSRDIQRDIMSLMTMADVVTVSTQDLWRKYKNFNANTITVPNAWNEKMFWYREPDKIARSKVVLWRGTRTHAEDLDLFLPEIAKSAAAFPEWKFVFIGGAYWKVHKYIPETQLNTVEPMEQTLFYETIYKLGAKIMIVPLADHTFNRAKSSIAWQEGSFCGSAVLGPDWEEWQYPGIVKYQNAETFGERLRELMDPASAPQVFAKESWKHISENLTLNESNAQRAHILNVLLGLN